MRNLKKILALVLALVMSLSLMATAGAADAAATSSETVTPAYEIALQVLGKDGLKVFGGYTDGTIRPQNNITRAEVAAILYRIVTGDVTDAQAGIYTDMANVNFNDLTGANWAKGYINYCANAQLIVGVGGNQFKPLANITGYATLAMILRALGYDKNGEFKGSGWEIRTASKARELGILKNVSENQLGSSATRELVAELLFRAMLCDKVTYNALTQDYDKTGVTLGYEVFSLEEVEGVVVANEYADLRRDANGKGTNKTAADDTTVLRDAAGKDRIVTVASGLEDLGETRVAYTIENGKRNQYDLKNVKLENPGKDTITYDGGEEFSSISSKITGSEAEHYVNFGENFSNVTTTIRVSYQASRIEAVYSARTAAEARADFVEDYRLTEPVANLTVTPSSYLGSGVYNIVYIPTVGDMPAAIRAAGHTYSVVRIPDVATGTTYYKVEIEPNSNFTTFDDTLVRAIFSRADLLPSAAGAGEIVVRGEVFRGTQATIDYSDWRSYESFREDCLKESEENTNVSSNGKGYWLKIIDNGNDGVTDWVFQTRYTMATVSAVKDGVPTLETEVSWGAPDAMNVMSNASSTTDESGDLAVGDVVYYAVIDGVARAWKADVVEGRVNTVNRTALTVTTTDGTTYEESANHEHSARVDIDSGVVNMSGTTNYKMYLDKYGYMAAFSQDISGKFVLLTNGWFQTLKNGVEYAVTAWDSETKAFAQYDITSGGNLFVNPNTGDGSNSWNRILRFPNVNCNDVNHTTAATTDDLHTIVAYMETEGENATLTPVDNVYDTERLNGQAKRMIDMGTRIPYSNVENGVLQTTTTTARQPYDTRGPVRTGDSATERVRALSTTTYYFVYRTWNIPNNLGGAEGGSIYVQQITGYEDASKYLVTTTDDAAHIEDVYVVGTRATDVFGTYYAADVVVVELDDTFYLNHHEQEEVFIYDFPVVSNTAKIEEVCAIRADGTKDEHLKIDLTGLRTYTEVTTGNLRYAPGLYYLTRTARTDSEGIWEVIPMTHRQVRTSGHYDAGTVVASDFTMPANYAEIRDWVCLDSALGTVADGHRQAAAVMTTYTNHTRKNIEGSDYYNLSISPATGAGTANETTASDCLRQLSGSNVTSDYNWNQVLVRYNEDNEIVYAISFAHTGANASGATVENLAQAAWRSVLMDQGRAAGIRSFIFTLPPTAFTLALDEDTTLTDVVDAITVDGVAATPTDKGTFTVDNIVEKPTYTIEITLKDGYTGTVELNAKYVTAAGNKLATLVKNADAENTYTLTISDHSVFDEFASDKTRNTIVQIVFNGDKIVETDPLATEKAAAKTQVAEYEKDKVAALTGEDATAATKAKTDADAAIDAADTEAKITAAVDAYKKAIDALITPEEPDQVTVKFELTGEKQYGEADGTVKDFKKPADKTVDVNTPCTVNVSEFEDLAPINAENEFYVWSLTVKVDGKTIEAKDGKYDLGTIAADTTVEVSYTYEQKGSEVVPGETPDDSEDTGVEIPLSFSRTMTLADETKSAVAVFKFVPVGKVLKVTNSTKDGGPIELVDGYPQTAEAAGLLDKYHEAGGKDQEGMVVWAIGYMKGSILFPIKCITPDEGEPDPVPVTDVTLNKAEETVVVDGTVTLTATVAPETATNKNVTWTSSDETVATVADGVVTGVAAGTATITVTTEDGGKTAACEVTVAAEAVAVTGVTLDKTEETVAVDGTVTLTATVAPAEATNKNVTWTSSDETVATVADGVVTGVAAGTATITVTTEDGEFTADCEITVVAETVAVTGVTLGQETATVAVGEEVTLEATVAPEEATNKNVTWESDDETIATVEDGVVTGVAAGTVTITVTTEDGEFTDTCEVTVEEDIAVETTVVLKGTTGAAIASVKGEDGQAIEADPANTYAATTGDELSVELTITGTPKYVVAVDKDGKVSEVTKTGDKYIAAITVAADAEYTFRVTGGELELFYPADPTYASANNWIEESSIELGTAIINVKDNASGSTTVADVVNNITTGLGAEVKVTAVYNADHVRIPEDEWTRYAKSGSNSVIGTIEVTVDGEKVVISEKYDPSLANLIFIKDEDGNLITTAEKGEDVTLNLAAGYYSIYDGTNYKQVTSGALAAAESDNWSTAPLAAATTVKFQIASDATYTELTVRDARWELIVDGASAEKVKADDPATAKVTGLTAANGNWYVVYETPAEGEPTLTTADYKELVADKTDSEKKMVPDFAMPAHNTTVTTKLFRIDVTTVDGETSTTETKFLATNGSVSVASGKKAIVQVKGASTNTVVDASDEAKTVAVEGKDKEITIADGSRIASLTLNESTVNILLGTTSKLNWYEWLVAQGVDEDTYVTIVVDGTNKDISGKNLANADPAETTYLKVSALEALDPQTVEDNTVVTTGFVKLTIKDETYADVAVKYATGTTVIGSGVDVDSAEVSVFVEKGTGVKIGTTDEFYTITVTGTPKAPVQSTTDGLWRGTISEDTVWTVVVKAIDDVPESAE